MCKKILVFICAASMVFSLAACGNTEQKHSESSEESKSSEVKGSTSEVAVEPKDPVVIDYWYCNGVGEQEYTQEVEDKLNEILANTEGYEHITINLVPCSSYSTDLSLAQTSEEKMDLISTGNLSVDQIINNIENGGFMPLDDLVAANPEIVSELPDWFMNYGIVDGQLWFIPNYQQCANQIYFVTPTEFFEHSGYTREQAQTILSEREIDKIAKFMEDYVLAVREYTNTDTKWINKVRISSRNLWIPNSNQIYNFGVSGTTVKLYWDQENECIAFSEYNEDVQKGYLQNGEWYKDGLLYPHALTDNDTLKAVNQNGEYSDVFTFASTCGTVEMVEKTMSASRGWDVTALSLWEDVYLPETNAAGGVAISSTCEYPEEAAKVLALLFNSKYQDFYNTLCYGLEGIHYNSNGDGTVETLEFSGAQGNASTTYCYWKWVGGNTFNSWLNQSMSQEQEDYILNEINESDTSYKSPLMGITFDTSSVETEIAQVKAVCNEYTNVLECGAKGADTESYLKEYLDKLDKAGISKILEEFNAQADAYLGK